MKRRHMLAALGLAFSIALSGHSAEPPSKPIDSWVGNYLKYAEFDSKREGQFGKAKTITITKDGDGYRLSKPYDMRMFTKTKTGVLSDGEGGLGRIYLGTAEYADGKKVRILRVEFCYEHFILYGERLGR